MNSFPTYEPEKLNLWNRLFNRYKTIPIESGRETWSHLNVYAWGEELYNRDFVIYHKIDRVTGGYEVIKKYHN